MKNPTHRHLEICLLTLVGATTATGCKPAASPSTGVVERAPAALYSSDPATISPGPASTLVASCPGKTFPDQCGSWEGVELKASTDSEEQRCLCRTTAFQVPASIPVTRGNAGTGDAFLTFRKAGAQLKKCTYHGNARFGKSGKQTGGDAYEFVNCTDRSKAGSTVTADWFSLEVHGCDKSQSPTEVRLRLGAPDVVNGVVQEEILYASDLRIPGAALHIPRGSTPPNQEFSFSVLPQPTVGSHIPNGDDPAVTTGYAVDVHATGVAQFAFADVAGATCPRIDLPYSPAALAAFAGPGAEGLLRARQITNLAGLSRGASVLARTSDVTVDPVNHLVSFCVAHLSYYVTIGTPNNARLCGAFLTRSPPRTCAKAADCQSGEVCACGTPAGCDPDGGVDGGADGGADAGCTCYEDLLAAWPPPPLMPSSPYVLHLDFDNNGTNAWSAANVHLYAVDPSAGIISAPWSANLPQGIGSSDIPKSGNASFNVSVISPLKQDDGQLDLCLVNGTSPIGECFSWESPHSVANGGSGHAPILEICDGNDNDSNGTIDDVNGNAATAVGVSCDNGQQPSSCNRAGHYVCDGLFATKCDAPIPVQTSCGGCTPLAQEPNTACDTGQVVDVCPVPGLTQCSGPDAVVCVAQTVPKNSCGGCLTLAGEPNTPCATGLKGLCAAPGAWACNGADAIVCAPSVTSVTEICDGLDNNCDGRIDEGCPFDVGYSDFLFDLNWSTWFGPGDPDGGFSEEFFGTICPVEAGGQTFASGLSTHSGTLVDAIDGLHCSQIALNKDKSVIPYQYSISWSPDFENPAIGIGGHLGGPGGGLAIKNCDSPGLMTGIRGTFNDNELISLEVECARINIDNATMTETGRYWAGPVGGNTAGTPYAFSCGPGQYITYFYAISTSGTPDVGFVKNVRIACAAIGVRE